MSPRAIALAEGLIRQFEKRCLIAIPDTKGRWQIGYGNNYLANGEPVCEGMSITDDQAETLLRATLDPLAAQVSALLPDGATDGQAAALLDFAWNEGINALRMSTLLRVYRDGDLLRAAADFGSWVYAGGRKLDGLVERRRAERALFCGIGVDADSADALNQMELSRVDGDSH